MKIRKLHLKNIGVFDDEEIKFLATQSEEKAEVHILTGENGTGKTTILQAIAIAFGELSTIDEEGALKITRSSNDVLKRFKSPANSKLNVEIDTDEGRTSANINLKPTSGGGHVLLRTDFLGHFDSYSKALESPFLYEFAYALFAFSGYRQVETETVQANYLPKDFNPLSQSLEFIKDYRKEGEITINQLVANNISNRALSKEDGSLEEAKKYETVINSIETFIKDVTDYEVKFVLKRSPNELKLRMHGEELDFDVLPDGLRSLISWIADLLGRVDLLKWQDDLPITEKNLILLLDEIEVHLHPAWQRKVLPIVQKLFKNAQIFVSTHSPFVVNSVDDAWVYELEVKNGKAKVREKSLTKTTESVQTTLEEVFEVPQLFGLEVQNDLDRFYELRGKLNKNGGKADKEFREIAKRLLKKSEEQNSAELQNIIAFELKQLKYEL